MAVADADGTAPAATPAGAGVAGGASLPGNQILPESGRAPNGFSLGERRDLPTGAATASPLPRELLLTEVFPQVRSPTTNPPSPLAENPRERLKAALHGIGQGSSWSNEQWSQYDNGFADGFIAGMEGTLNLIQSAPKLFWDAITLKTERAVLGAGVKLTLWSWAVVGDEIGSWWYGTPPVELKEGVARSRAGANTAATAARIAADLNAMGYEMLKTVLVEGSNPNTPKPAELQKEEAAAIDRALGRASPLTIALLDLVAEAVYDLSPHDQGYIVGLVAEQVVEWAVVSAATEGGRGSRAYRIECPRRQGPGDHQGIREFRTPASCCEGVARRPQRRPKRGADRRRVDRGEEGARCLLCRRNGSSCARNRCATSQPAWSQGPGRRPIGIRATGGGNLRSRGTCRAPFDGSKLPQEEEIRRRRGRALLRRSRSRAPVSYQRFAKGR